MTVLHGRTEIGTIDPMLLTTKIDGPRLLVLAGKPWEVTHIDWRRRRVFVEPSDRGVVTKWTGESQPYSFALSDAIRRVLLGTDPPSVTLSQRATERLALVRGRYAPYADPDCTVVAADDAARMRWWTFAGARANAVLDAALAAISPDLLDTGSFSNLNIPLRGEASSQAVSAAMRAARGRFGADLGGVVPEVSDRALKKLKFSELLPPELAVRTLAARAADHQAAAATARRPITTAVHDPQ